VISEAGMSGSDSGDKLVETSVFVGSIGAMVSILTTEELSAKFSGDRSSVSIDSSWIDGRGVLGGVHDLVGVDDFRFGRIMVTESDESSDSDEKMGVKSAQDGNKIVLSIGPSVFIIFVRVLKAL
jgi:hypothetical protein